MGSLRIGIESFCIKPLEYWPHSKDQDYLGVGFIWIYMSSLFLSAWYKHMLERRSHQLCLSHKYWSTVSDQENNEFYRILHSRRNQLVATPRNYQGWQWRLTRKMSGWFCLKGTAHSYKTTAQFFWHVSLLSSYAIKSLFLKSLNIFFTGKVSVFSGRITTCHNWFISSWSLVISFGVSFLFSVLFFLSYFFFKGGRWW